MTSSDIERRWQRAWAEARAFEAEPGDGPKYFLNVPYPYVNGLLHLGQALTYSRTDFMARYKRLRGFNVLFPFAFHATGTPIVAAAGRVARGEERQISILRQMGIPDAEMPRFGDPQHWVDHFPGEVRADIQRLGGSVDWRRSFITTSLNPRYDAFIGWQFRRLRARDLVRRGRHPVVWCPKDGSPVGDHDRIQGEGEMPQEFTVLKFRMDDGSFLVAATLRPETVFGQTNLWIDPDVDYAVAEVDGETWIASASAVEKLAEQAHAVNRKGTVRGSDLIGREAVAPMIRRRIPVLPSTFTDPDKGTGIVTSVPSDAPDDWIALQDIKRGVEGARRWGLDPDAVRGVEAIPIIESGGWGPLPAKEICERMGIRSQDERDRLLEAKHEIYKTGFYTGVMKENCGEYAGMPVEVAKEAIKAAMLASGEASLMYELSNRVVCRCLTPSIVKIVSDQWFLAYGDAGWKALARECLAGMDLYPEVSRKQFEHVLGWLRDWACTRELGLGTRLPWDGKWMIESLSDSTIYMAFYTISHLLDDVPEEAVRDELFDHVFLGVGAAEKVSRATGAPVDAIEAMRRSFLHWYPMDLRISGKDLIQNHLSFCIFNHVGVFDRGLWPRGFGVNGWILVGGAKMSKSAGNFMTMRAALDRWGADVLRLTLANGGDGLDDPNFDAEFADSTDDRLAAWLAFAVETMGKGTDAERPIDAWFSAVLDATLADFCGHCDSMEFRAALKRGYFDLQRDLRWYLRRAGEPDRAVMERFIAFQTQMLSVFAPHVCEEAWSRTDGKGMVSLSRLPDVDPASIDRKAIDAESLLIDLMEDLREVIGLIGGDVRAVHVFTAADWKWHVLALVRAAIAEGGARFDDVMKAVMADPDARRMGKAVPRIVQRMIDLRTSYDLTVDEERSKLAAEAAFLSAEFGCPVRVWTEGESEDPMGKAKQALPLKPAIYVEK